MRCYLIFVFHFFAGLSFVVVLDRFFFSFRETKKKWSLVALDRWPSYTVTIVWEFAWADSGLIVLDEWSSIIEVVVGTGLTVAP